MARVKGDTGQGNRGCGESGSREPHGAGPCGSL